jgi:hypothetical protein
MARTVGRCMTARAASLHEPSMHARACTCGVPAMLHCVREQHDVLQLCKWILT